MRSVDPVVRLDAAYETAFRASPVAMAISSLVDSRLLAVNDAAARLVGCAREDLIGERGDALGLWLCPEERARCGAMFVEHGAVRDFATRMRRKSGELIDVILSVEPVVMFDQRCALTVISDVTPLRRSEELLAKAFRLSPAAMGIVRIADGLIVDLNDAALALAGRTRDELVGHTTVELGLWFDETQRARLYAEVAAGREVRDMPVRLTRKDGEIRIATMSVERLELGGEHCMLAVITDVTETQATQRMLEEAQTIGRVGSWSLDVRSGELEWSKEARNILGAEACSGGDEDWRHLLADGDIASVLAGRERALDETGVFDGEYSIVRSNGERRSVYARGRVERDADGNPMRLVGVLQDVTEAHEMQRRLAASEERYRRIVETTAQGVLTDDGEIITFANHRAAEMLGSTPEALIGRPVHELVAPEAHGELAVRRERRLAGLVDTYDLPLLTTAGERVLVEVNATPLRDASGAVMGALAMFSDVRLRRQAEETRARLAAIVESSRDAITSCALDGTIQTWNAAAEHLYGYRASEAIGMNVSAIVPPERRAAHGELTGQLQRGEVVALETTCLRKDGTRADIVLTCSPVLDAMGNVVAISSIARDISAQRHAQKMEAIGALAGGIAHDFNNILSVVLSSATLIEDALEPRDPILDDVRAVREASERAATLTRQLLAFSRRQVLEPRVISLDKIISGMEKMLRRLLGERIELVMSTGHTANVLIDPGQFEQVIMNLVVNARDAMPEGGQLSIETDAVTHAGRGYVQVRVTDTGVGMDDTTRQRMFEPFFTTKERGKGTGLGLATVFGIVEQSGGFVNVDSARGHGTTISIFIPRTERTEAIGLPVAEPVGLGTRSETILVVEDEELVRRLVMKLLRREGYEVLGAANAGEALLIAEQRRDIDVLLTDVVMPIMNGRQLAERLHAMVPGLRIAFMSGYHDDEVLRGMTGVVHLQKPVPRAVLVEKLRELLDGPIIPECGSPRSSSS